VSETYVDRARGPWARGLYQLVRFVVALVSRFYWRMTVTGRENVPDAGPFIVAPVHRSIVDTLVVSAITGRRLRYMGKDELWKYRWSSWLLSALGGFPVHRGGADREALRRCVAVIEGAEPLVIFPEGTRREGLQVQTLFEGAAYVAARTGAPILPVGIAGTEEIMPKGAKMIRPGRVHLEIGELIPAPTSADGSRAPRRTLSETTERLHGELQQLFDRAQGAVARR
jgi:1-acyl-sn-glycerol-3-phosphate acyltransferase